MAYHYNTLVRPVQTDLLSQTDKRCSSGVLNECLDILDANQENPNNNNIGVKTIENNLETGGLDWLSLSTYGKFEGIEFESLLEALRDCKKAAANDDDENSYFYGMNGHVLQVGPYGIGKGAGRCEFLLKIDGFSIGLTGKKESEDQKPNLYLVIPSMPLMQYGMKEIIHRINSLLKTIGYHPKRMCVSRADLCVDLPGIGQEYFSNSYRKGKIICRSQTYQEIGRSLKSQTLKLGAAGAEISCRIYDKIEEMKNSPEKEEVVRKKRIGDAEKATRVEFQIRKKALRDKFKVETLQDLIKSLETISEYLCDKWIRISTRVVSRTNTASEKISKKETEKERYQREIHRKAFKRRSNGFYLEVIIY